MVDGTVVDEVPIDNLPFVLMAAFLCTTSVIPKVVITSILFWKCLC